MELKLDTNALNAMINADPKFKLKLQTAVIANIITRQLKTIPGDVGNAIAVATKAVQAKAVEEYGSYHTNYPYKFNLNEKFEGDIRAKVSLLASNALQTLIQATLDDEVNRRLLSLKGDIERRVESAIKQYETKLIADRVNEKINEVFKLVAKG